MVLLSADWVCTFVFFIVLFVAPCTGCCGGWVILGLVLQWFPLCEFSLLILPRVCSLVV